MVIRFFQHDRIDQRCLAQNFVNQLTVIQFSGQNSVSLIPFQNELIQQLIFRIYPLATSTQRRLNYRCFSQLSICMGIYRFQILKKEF
jgi:hypothetical protein